MLSRRHFALTALSVFSIAVGASAEGTAEPDLNGHWSGCWVSDSDGHHGPLQARFCRIDDCRYEVHFQGRFKKVIPFRFKATLNVVGRDGDKVILSGSQHLPVFGTFEYTATASDREFHADFTSKKDYGRFELTRDCK
jgi:hypothetical protein